jgi:fatty-acyl-CoA synthase
MTRPALDAGPFDPIAWWGAHEPTREALIDAERRARVTYGALDHAAARWRDALQSLGVGAGDRVAILAHNRVEHLLLLAATARLGAILVPLNWRLADRELARVLADCTPRVLLGTDTFRGAGERAARLAGYAEPVWVDLDRDVSPLLARRRAAGATAVPASADDAALLLYTSGSTGEAKGVVVPHRQLHWNAFATISGWEMRATDVAAVTTPFFHTSGWGVFALPLLAVGGRVVVHGAFEPAAVLHALQAHGVTHAFGVPTQWQALSTSAAWGRPLPSLRWFLTGGAPCPRRVHDAVTSAGYAFREGYGLTECGPNCFATTEVIARAQPGTVGHPVPLLGARVIGDDGTPVTVADAIGELQLRGPQRFGGYWQAPTRTAEVLTGDGWLRTGDLVSRGADGVWRVRGRRKEMFITGGENVFPGEVEAALLDCIGVAEACVVGVAHDTWGEVGEALVVAAPGHDGLRADAVLAEVRTRLAGYKVPRALHVATSLPRLGSGKLDRAAVAAHLDALRRGDPAAPRAVR